MTDTDIKEGSTRWVINTANNLELFRHDILHRLQSKGVIAPALMFLCRFVVFPLCLHGDAEDIKRAWNITEHKDRLIYDAQQSVIMLRPLGCLSIVHQAMCELLRKMDNAEKVLFSSMVQVAQVANDYILVKSGLDIRDPQNDRLLRPVPETIQRRQLDTFLHEHQSWIKAFRLEKLPSEAKRILTEQHHQQKRQEVMKNRMMTISASNQDALSKLVTSWTPQLQPVYAELEKRGISLASDMSPEVLEQLRASSEAIAYDNDKENGETGESYLINDEFEDTPEEA